MKLALRVLLLVVVFAGVGFLTYDAVLAHVARPAGAYLPEMRLAAMMAGLFAGGAVAVITGIGLALSAQKR